MRPNTPHREIYFKNNMDMSLVLDLGNLREVVDPEWVPPINPTK